MEGLGGHGIVPRWGCPKRQRGEPVLQILPMAQFQLILQKPWPWQVLMAAKQMWNRL